MGRRSAQALVVFDLPAASIAVGRLPPFIFGRRVKGVSLAALARRLQYQSEDEKRGRKREVSPAIDSQSPHDNVPVVVGGTLTMGVTNSVRNPFI